jgi:hypothetical protein
VDTGLLRINKQKRVDEKCCDEDSDDSHEIV